jgi:hypothetical protein
MQDGRSENDQMKTSKCSGKPLMVKSRPFVAMLVLLM